MSIAGSSSIRRLKDVAVVMSLDKLAPVGRWAPGRRDGWWLQRLTEVCQNLSDRPKLRDERDEPDVAAAAGGSVRTPAVASVSVERPWSRQMPKGCAAAPDRAVQIPLLGTRARVLGIRDRCRP
jgi:hypothetical protein